VGPSAVLVKRQIPSPRGESNPTTPIVRLYMKKERKLGRPSHGWKNSIKMDFKEMGCVVMDWINLAQDRMQWWIVVNTVMNILVT
jgi:hypothetical protein